MVAAAVVGGVVSAGGSVLAANKNKKAISKSTDAQVQAQKEALESQERMARESLAVQTAALNASMGLQTGAYNSSGKMQSDIYNNNVGMLNPFTQTGYAASDQINALLGLPKQGGYTPQSIAFTPVKADPVALPPSVTNALAPPATTPTGPVTPSTNGPPATDADIAARSPQYAAALARRAARGL